jgi:hypothetical protein
MSYLDLSELDLSGSNLSSKVLYGAKLTNTNLDECNLTEADLREANTVGATFNGAIISALQSDWSHPDVPVTQTLPPPYDQYPGMKRWNLPDGGQLIVRYHDREQHQHLAAIEYRDARGRLSRDPGQGPALLEWYQDGNIKTKGYYMHSLISRPYGDGPAIERWHENGQQSLRSYAMWDRARPEPEEIAAEPPFQYWDKDGNLR